jgi:hypothetical protein
MVPHKYKLEKLTSLTTNLLSTFSDFSKSLIKNDFMLAITFRPIRKRCHLFSLLISCYLVSQFPTAIRGYTYQRNYQTCAICYHEITMELGNADNDWTFERVDQ